MKNNFKSFLFEERHSLLIFETNNELLDYFKINFPERFRYIAVSDIKEATEIIKRRNISLILSNISDPIINGFELCKKIKSNLNTCQIPFVFSTAKICIKQKIKGYELGADDFIIKPYNKNLITAQINRMIQNWELINKKCRITKDYRVELGINHISKNEKFMKAVRKVLEDNLSDPDFNVTGLSEKLQISTTQLYRNLKELTGYTPVEFIRIVRLKNAYKMLSNTNDSITEICYCSGFNNVSYFIKCFRDMFGFTPGYFRNSVGSEVLDLALW